MRILVLNWRDHTHPRRGGAELFVREVAARWIAAGHDVTLFCASSPGAPEDERVDGMRVVRRGSRTSIYRHARAFMRAEQWDAIFESVNTRPYFAHLVAPRTPSIAMFYQLAKDVWFYEASPPVAAVGRFVLEPIWLRRFRNRPVLALSGSTKEGLERAGLTVAGIVPPGRPEAPFEHPPPKEPEPTFLFVGRLQRSKRPDHAVAAFKTIRARISDAKLWIVGEGPMRKDIEAAGTEGVTVFGRVDETTKWSLLARAHLLLVPSVREGWGLVVSEAAAAGTPAVGYRVPGLVDSIVDGTTGWLCDTDPDAMAATALAAMPMLDATARRAKEQIEALSWDATAGAILNAAVYPARLPGSKTIK